MSNNLVACIWVSFAAAIFAVVLALVKIAIVDFSVFQILLFRQLLVFISTTPILVKTFPRALKTQRPLLHGLRLSGAFVALSASMGAVALLPLSTASAIAFLQAFFVVLLAWRFLGERASAERLLVVIIGFSGVLVALRPWLGEFDPLGIGLGVIAAFGAAIAVICVRALSTTESTATLLIYQSVFVGLLSMIPMAWLWITPSFSQLVLLIAIGALSALAQWLGVKALRTGEASVVGSVEYSKLLYATLLGYMLFAEVPDSQTVLGAAIIIGASIMLFRQQSRPAIG